jgi:hypothetical protein
MTTTEDGRLGRVEGILEEIRSRLTGLESRMDSMDARNDSRFNGIETRMDSMDARNDSRFNGIETRMDSMDAPWMLETIIASTALKHGCRPSSCGFWAS